MSEVNDGTIKSVDLTCTHSYSILHTEVLFTVLQLISKWLVYLRNCSIVVLQYYQKYVSHSLLHSLSLSYKRSSVISDISTSWAVLDLMDVIDE
jgi:hypothetical protein